uniref:Uncharacterized protein n=1 Tax=Alexandrium monilatum TaxID=311494 RepID=A0A7S4QAP8_9DINO
MVTMLLGSEVFPTQVRGFAFSTTLFVGRFGSEVAQVAVHGGPAVFPAAAACLAVAALSLVQCLPETKDAELANFCTEPQPERVGPSGPDRPADKLGAGLAGGKGVPSYGAAGQAAAAPEAADKEA